MLPLWTVCNLGKCFVCRAPANYFLMPLIECDLPLNRGISPLCSRPLFHVSPQPRGDDAMLPPQSIGYPFAEDLYRR